MLCSERQVLCHTVEGVGSFGAIIEFNVFKRIHSRYLYGACSSSTAFGRQ